MHLKSNKLLWNLSVQQFPSVQPQDLVVGGKPRGPSPTQDGNLFQNTPNRWPMGPCVNALHLQRELPGPLFLCWSYLNAENSLSCGAKFFLPVTSPVHQQCLPSESSFRKERPWALERVSIRTWDHRTIVKTARLKIYQWLHNNVNVHKATERK